MIQLLLSAVQLMNVRSTVCWRYCKWPVWRLACSTCSMLAALAIILILQTAPASRALPRFSLSRWHSSMSTSATWPQDMQAQQLSFNSILLSLLQVLITGLCSPHQWSACHPDLCACEWLHLRTRFTQLHISSSSFTQHDFGNLQSLMCQWWRTADDHCGTCLHEWWYFLADVATINRVQLSNFADIPLQKARMITYQISQELCKWCQHDQFHVHPLYCCHQSILCMSTWAGFQSVPASPWYVPAWSTGHV